MNGALVAAEARRWLGTRYGHQNHSKGVSCDCAGLVAGVAVELRLVPADWWQKQGKTYAGYSRQPSNGMLERICDGFMTRVPLEEIAVGDVVGIRWSTETQHLAIVGNYPLGGLSIIHSYERAGRVVEHRLSDLWRKNISHVWRMPGVE